MESFFDLMYEFDEHGNRMGISVPGGPAESVVPEVLTGTRVRLEPLDADQHAADLYSAYEGHDQLWTYMPQGPFASVEEYSSWVNGVEHRADPMFFAIVDQETNQAVGVASYLRNDVAARSVEVGWITFSPQLQRTAGATEAMYLMMRNAFDRGYRRYEWKCNALNDASKDAAERLGMTFEGVFRQATVVKGRNRDTAWFALLDSDWPDVKRALEGWLAPSNFDMAGVQITSLSGATKPSVGRSWREFT